MFLCRLTTQITGGLRCPAKPRLGKTSLPNLGRSANGTTVRVHRLVGRGATKCALTIDSR